MVHNPKHKVHSFRGLLADGGQDEITLERQNVNIAYRIVKLSVIGNKPGFSNPVESVVSVWREEQSSLNSSTDFGNPDLLAVGMWTMGETTYTNDVIVIFDNILFSRNIWVSHLDHQSSEACNYYIELEEVPVTASTLMQIKLGTARTIKTKESMG